MDSQFVLEDDAATRRLGAALAGMLRVGDVVALHGDLGAGKTTLARGLIQSLLGEAEEVPSPTYTLVQTYAREDGDIWHFDLYRMKTPDDLADLGWDESMDGIALVEWPEHAGTQLPEWRLDVVLEMDGDQRKVQLTPHGKELEGRFDGFRF